MIGNERVGRRVRRGNERGDSLRRSANFDSLCQRGFLLKIYWAKCIFAEKDQDDVLLWIHFVVVRNWNFHRNNHQVSIEYSIQEIHEKLSEFHRINTRDGRITEEANSKNHSSQCGNRRSDFLIILLVIGETLAHRRFALLLHFPVEF